MDRGTWWATVHGIPEKDLSEQLSMHASDIQQNLEDIQKSREKYEFIVNRQSNQPN